MIPPETVAPIESVTASSLMGWAAFVFGLGTFAILVWDRVVGKGKSLATIDGKIDNLCEKVEEVQQTQTIMDGHLDTLSREVQSLTSEWRGFDGNNGARSVIRKHTEQIAQIVKRNERLDAIREEDIRRSGGQSRRAMDREMDEGEGSGEM